MRPKIKGDTFYVPVSEGIYFRNNQGAFVLKGKVVYRWFERLVPYLDGQYTLEEIVQGLPAEKQTMIQDLVRILVHKGFLKNVASDLPHQLLETELRLYAPEIAFIDSFTDSAAYRFEQYRNSRILLIGSGLTFTGLVHALLRSGVRQVALLATTECPVYEQRHADYLGLYNSRGAEQTLIHLPSLAWDNAAEVTRALAPFDVVIAASDRPMLLRARMLNRLCLSQQKILIQAVLVANHAWIGPLVRPTTSSCWECAWRRLQGHLPEPAQQPDDIFQDYSTAPPSRFLALPPAALVANQLSFEMFKLLTGIERLETDTGLIAIDMETASTQKHVFMSHPLCGSCQFPEMETQVLFQDTVRVLEQGEPLAPEAFSRQIAACFEPRLGLFNSLDEHDFIQLPLRVAQAVVSRPVIQPHRSDHAVIGTGLDFSTARRRAAQRACEIYAASIIDPRRLPQPTSVDESCLVTQMEWLQRGLQPVGCREWVWAQGLHTGETHLVPAALVYPTLSGLAPSHETAPGLASGLSWAEAICRAIIACCRYWTMTHVEDLREPAPLVNLAALPLEGEGARYRSMLHLLAEPVAIYDVTALLRLPTFAFCRSNDTIVYSSHVDAREALVDGLEQMMLYLQSVTHCQPQYAPPVVPNLPLALRGTCSVVPADGDIPLDWLSRQRWLQQLLHAQGWQAFAVPLRHDPALTAVLPYIVHVLLARA
ncbi:MAG TPA: TOMM precursor leader peptide-binding protein [Ktedonobacteraceae bacterium]|nr:TOMM precursor leader peptide-binding protein [Ktedonobacteraceae bacterium]